MVLLLAQLKMNRHTREQWHFRNLFLNLNDLMSVGALLYINNGIFNFHEEIIPKFCKFHFYKAIRLKLKDK